MRIDEFASAEEQLALWKLVSDNVWSAIAMQAEQERRAKAEKAARSKPKRGKRKSSPKAPKPAAPKSATPAKPNAADTDSKTQQQAAVAQQPVNPASVQPRGPYGATAVQPRAPIQPIAPVTTSAATPQVQQPVPKQQKPRIMARAGGMTV